jgi:hypothetical protein
MRNIHGMVTLWSKEPFCAMAISMWRKGDAEGGQYGHTWPCMGGPCVLGSLGGELYLCIDDTDGRPIASYTLLASSRLCSDRLPAITNTVHKFALACVS